MPRRTHKPFDPRLGRTAGRRAAASCEAPGPDTAPPSTWGVAAEALDLPANAAVLASRDGRGRVISAHRADVFEVLHGRGGLSDAELAAARRLERDIGLRAGRFAPERSYVLVDGQGAREEIAQRMLEAGRRVDRALCAIGPRQALLLRALIEPALVEGRAVDWREAVARETRETHLHAQAAMVRSALDNLHLAYQAIDHAPRRREAG